MLERLPDCAAAPEIDRRSLLVFASAFAAATLSGCSKSLDFRLNELPSYKGVSEIDLNDLIREQLTQGLVNAHITQLDSSLRISEEYYIKSGTVDQAALRERIAQARKGIIDIAQDLGNKITIARSKSDKDLEPKEIFGLLKEVVFSGVGGFAIATAENPAPATFLEVIEQRRADCVGLVSVCGAILNLLERSGIKLPISPCLAPNHITLRWCSNPSDLFFECTDRGNPCNSEFYSKYFDIDPNVTPYFLSPIPNAITASYLIEAGRRFATIPRDLEKSRYFFELAEKLTPNNPELLENLGKINLEIFDSMQGSLSDLSRSEAYFKRARDLDPVKITNYFLLARCYEKRANLAQSSGLVLTNLNSAIIELNKALKVSDRKAIPGIPNIYTKNDVNSFLHKLRMARDYISEGR